MSKSWKRFGVNIKIKAPRSENIIRWGNKKNDERDIQSENHP